jgi:DNA-binding CsgD family transcriptional regulator/PAS domain-containing protein
MYDSQIKLSHLIGQVYDAALDQSKWQDAIRNAADFVGGSGSALFTKDPAAQQGSVSYSVGIDPHYKQLYFEKYISLDPATRGHFLAEIDEPVAVVDLMPYGEFLESRFYKEWVRPQHLVDFVSAVLDKSITSAAMFGVFRHERNGVVDDEARRRMRLIVPHIRRAVLVGRMFDLKAAEVATFADALDSLSAGICLVDAAGRIVYANAAGRVILDAGDVLRAIGGRLVACDAQVDQTLGKIFAAAGQGDAALGTMGIAVPMIGKHGDRYVGHILPLTSGARRAAGTSYTAAAAFLVRKAGLVAPSAFEVIGRIFKLTPAEIRVLLAIVEVGGVAETAESLGLAATTVKTHLGRLFEKTGAARQADLVKLVASYAPPLAG